MHDDARDGCATGANELTALLPPRLQAATKLSGEYTTRASCPLLTASHDLAVSGRPRSNSMPVLSRAELGRSEVSTMFYSKFYSAKGGTVVTSAFNLASATIGAGVLALPYAVWHTGLLGAALCLLLIYLLNVYSVYLLIRVGELTELNTYEDIAFELGGKAWQRVTVVLMVTFCWGVAVTYIVVMGDFITPIVAQLRLAPYVGRKTAMVVFWGVVMFPLSLARRIHTLRYASIVGTVATLLLTMALVIIQRSPAPEPGGGVPGSFAGVGLLRLDAQSLGALSTFLFSYCCQPVVFQVYASMTHPSPSRITSCAVYSMGLCTLVYLLTGSFGAAAYGAETQTNILSNLGKDELTVWYAVLAYFGMALTVTMAFPMTIFPTRDSVVLALGYHAEDAPVPHWLSSTIAGVLAVLALLMGLFIPSLRVLFDLLGGVCGGSLSFLLPGWFVLRLARWQPTEIGVWHLRGAWLLVALGAFMCIAGTYSSVRANFF